MRLKIQTNLLLHVCKNNILETRVPYKVINIGSLHKADKNVCFFFFETCKKKNTRFKEMKQIYTEILFSIMLFLNGKVHFYLLEIIYNYYM